MFRTFKQMKINKKKKKKALTFQIIYISYRVYLYLYLYKLDTIPIANFSWFLIQPLQWITLHLHLFEILLQPDLLKLSHPIHLAIHQH